MFRPRPTRGLLACGMCLAGAACSSAPPGAAPAWPTGTEVETVATPYEVRGRTAEQILDQMRARGPAGQPFASDWSIDWDLASADLGQALAGGTAPGRCRVSSLRLSVTLRRTVPEWRDAAEASESLRSRWARFAAATALHFEGHDEVAARTAHELTRHLHALETPSCSALAVEARSVAVSVLAAGRTRDRDYDRTTDHGARQGARWPPG